MNSHHFHAVIWIDHHEARVFHFSPTDVERLVLHPERNRRSSKRRAARRPSAQRAHRLVGHGDAPVLSEVANSSSSKQDAPSRYRVAVPAARSALPRERFSPLTHIGH